MNKQKLINLFKNPNTNWKYIAVVAILAFIAGAIITNYLSKAKTGFEIPQVTFPERKDETKDWKTYRNEEYGFEIKYPFNLSAKNWASRAPNWDLLVYVGENKDIGDGSFSIRIERGVSTIGEKLFFPLEVGVSDLEDVVIGKYNYQAKKYSFQGNAHELGGNVDFVDYFIEYGGNLYQIRYDRLERLTNDQFNQILSTFMFIEKRVLNGGITQIDWSERKFDVGGETVLVDDSTKIHLDGEEISFEKLKSIYYEMGEEKHCPFGGCWFNSINGYIREDRIIVATEIFLSSGQ